MRYQPGLVRVLAMSLLIAMSGSVRAQVKIDPKLAEYKAVTGVSGNLKSIGSDTMNTEMTLWAEAFVKFYPNVSPEIEGKGSATGPAAGGRPVRRARRTHRAIRRASPAPW